MYGKTLRNRVGMCFSRVTAAAVAAVAGLADSSFNNKLEMFRKRLDAESIGRKFAVSEDALSDVSRRMMEVRGVTCIGWPPASRSKAPPVRRFLGLYLAAGTHFHTRLAMISDTNDVLVWRSEHPLAAGVRAGSGRALFDHVARGLAKFANGFGVRAAGLPLAFAFGFPVQRTDRGAVILDRWNKEFDCAGFAGRDLMTELRASLNRAGVVVGPVALLDDATVAMVNSAADVPDTRVGLVVDDGCDCCYADTVRETRRARYAARRVPVAVDTNVVVNAGWGAYGEDGSLNHLLTEFDLSLDARSLHPGKRIFEKMTSGMYMGELVRELVLAMAVRGVLFGGMVTSAMYNEYRLNAAHLSLVESDARRTYTAGRAVLAAALNVTDPTDLDCELFRYACECVTKRSAHLVAAGLAGVLRHVADGRPTAVAVGGSVFETHGKYVFAVGGMAQRLLCRDRGPAAQFVLRKASHVVGAPLMAVLLAGSAA